MSDTSAPHPNAVKPGDQVILVDGSSFVFRAYFQSMNQDRKYNTRSDGLPTGAVRLFCTKLLQFIREGAVGIRPTHLAIIFDKSEDSFRREIYPDYKAHRPDPPAELIPQFPLMREAVRAFGLVPVEQERYEADDIIAAYSCAAEKAGADVLIVSADKDLMQLVTDKVTFYDFESGVKGKPGYRPERRLDRAGVIEKFGVPPEKVTDVQALVGDPTDNVPGVPGIGIKTAAQLITEFGDLETLLSRLSEIKQPKRRETLIENAERARLSKRLVTLDCDMAVGVPLADLALGALDAKRLVAFLKALEFTTLTKRVADAYGVDPAEIEPDAAIAQRFDGAAPAQGEPLAAGAESAAPAAAGVAAAAPPAPAGGMTPQALAAARAEAAKANPCDRSGYETITTIERLDAWIAEAFERGLVAFDTETTGLDAMSADLVGISLALEPGRAAYVPLLHRNGSGLFDSALLPDQIGTPEAIERLKPLMESAGVLKIGQNLKFDWLMLARYGIEVAPYDDTMLISYVLDAGRGGISSGHGMDELALRFLNHKCIAYADVAGKGKSAVTFDLVPIDKAAEYAAEDADVTLRLWRVLKPRLAAERLTTVYETLERPMVETLARMERRGIAIDRQILSRMSAEFAQALGGIEEDVYALAGERFTIGSPKQLGDILFGRMGLPGAKKTATGQWATGARTLEELAAEGHPLPRKVLDWRQLAKLKSTYTDLLPGYVNRETGRVHTSYALAATTTGRLSSSEPNLQNIPIRTEEGRKIRKAFVATPGHKLISADYSQIELRVLAHMADIPQLKKAFSDGIDIHAMTASEMFGVPVEGMPSDVRRRAKAINFGIVYGISAFGLAEQLAIPRDEAGAYIRRYFERFPGIRAYMDETKRLCRERGYVTTVFGRICHYPDINSSNPSQRAAVERQAINAPIQGSAADIIRRAMVRMEGALAAAGLSARMLLQVHDELVFEVPEEEVERTLPVVADVMENAPLPAVQLSVPLKVEARAADNWDDAH
ncbi:DNA polymerase I [Prosthecomicrobium pneumaticum]|uniref:DNA polymerase I n=1 Tax=Prosthecomicrobium pneumaticum TaxID=81895 RepID=A0A7W9FNR6_9HYPH|nr:DNA polymerase I [Prosthecomicrobium pneumaticum]MBB5754001.1 DNA polymerase-1 [Prosthecomicrobium pneumaticum]